MDSTLCSLCSPSFHNAWSPFYDICLFITKRGKKKKSFGRGLIQLFRNLLCVSHDVARFHLLILSIDTFTNVDFLETIPRALLKRELFYRMLFSSLKRLEKNNSIYNNDDILILITKQTLYFLFNCI